MNELEKAIEKHRRAHVVYYAVINRYEADDDSYDYFYGEDDRRRKHVQDLYVAAETARIEVKELKEEMLQSG